MDSADSVIDLTLESDPENESGLSNKKFSGDSPSEDGKPSSSLEFMIQRLKHNRNDDKQSINEQLSQENENTGNRRLHVNNFILSFHLLYFPFISFLVLFP